MTPEEKQLLVRTLCEMSPYGVKIKVRNNNIRTVRSVDVVEGVVHFVESDPISPFGVHIEHPMTLWQVVKPYLHPMSGMTEEERIEFSKLLDRRYCEEDWEGHTSTSYCIEVDNVYTDDEGRIKYPSPFSMDAIDWLNSHHFDYRGLIPIGLALEAPEGMYN